MLNRIFFLAAGLCVAALALAHGYARRDMAAPERPLWDVTIRHLKRCCDMKYSLAAQYDHYERIALREGYDKAAGLFRAMACSQRIHSRNFVRSLEKLGSRYRIRSFPAVNGSTTADNLGASLALERHLAAVRVPEAIGAALGEEAFRAARVLGWAAGADMHKCLLLERCCETLSGARPAGRGYVVCPECGRACEREHADSFCPFCLTGEAEYLVYE